MLLTSLLHDECRIIIDKRKRIRFILESADKILHRTDDILNVRKEMLTGHIDNSRAILLSVLAGETDGKDSPYQTQTVKHRLELPDRLRILSLEVVSDKAVPEYADCSVVHAADTHAHFVCPHAIENNSY